MSIPDPAPDAAAPAGWYPTGESGPDGMPVERWWDGASWSAMVRPLGSTESGGGRRGRTRALIAAGIIVILAGAGVGIYFAVHNSNAGTATASSTPPAPNNGGGNNNGNGGGNGGGNGNPSPSPSPQPTVNGGSGQAVTDPINGLTIPVPSGWSGIGGTSTTGAALSTGPYTCPSALAAQNPGTNAQCTRGGVDLNLVQGSGAQQVASSYIATLAKDNYGTLTSHTVVKQGAITVAGQSGYQITWSVVPSYQGPGGTVEAIAFPSPAQPGNYALIDVGVDNTSQAPSLSSVNSQIVAGITNSTGAGV